MTRAVPEWRGKTPDTKVPPRVRLRIFERDGGRCHISGRKIAAGEPWELEHKVALCNGGEHRESNLAPALKDKHREKPRDTTAPPTGGPSPLPPQEPEMTRAVVEIEPALFRLSDAATYLGIGETRLRDLVASGKLRWIDLSGGDKRRAMRFHKADLDSFIEASRRQALPCPSTSQRAQSTTSMTSNSVALDFAQLRAQRTSAKLSRSKRG